ncbi:hypothetical protein [Geobacter sp. SVR]|uniref:hypothetical protein n=1 Tax=Geobacter sp. SVR TaxID=2495594 RepID=UPI00143F00C7|nr:hypothetical protein [Geobacter sp. SVR]BCS52519.1 hypothetical protein GSVR_08270 [Geobacter sp. SVR]GCF84044.1 hypothetical protein GSbR_06440 [Geobacter sp. SVR]
MKRISIIAATLLLAGTYCHAGCTCDDWVKKGGYCVDYVKSRVPLFPIPKDHAEITELKNEAVSGVSEGDVALFDLGNYWHVAYVEKVLRDRHGNATGIDVSEMNFGGEMSFEEYKNRWNPKSESEWRRAVCCGVTDKYFQLGFRRNVPLSSVTQVWSPPSEGFNWRDGKAVAGKAREVLNRFFLFLEREL